MIRRYRKARGVSQEEVALAIGRSYGLVSQWENGRVHPRRPIAYRLDEFLGAGGEIVAALGYTMPSDPNHPEPTNGAVRDEILEELRELRDEVDEKLATLADMTVKAVAAMDRIGDELTRLSAGLAVAPTAQSDPTPTGTRRS